MSFPFNNPPSPRDEEPPPAEGVSDHNSAAPVPVLAGEPPLEQWTLDPPVPRPQTGRRLRRLGWELLQTLVLAALIFLAVRAIAQNFRVEGSSMEPGLQNGQYLLVNKALYFKLNLSAFSKVLPFVHADDEGPNFLFRGPKRGDVIVFRPPHAPEKDFIKRVIGVPGDTVEVRGGAVFVNGAQLDEPYSEREGGRDFQPDVVPARSYFVLGDNRRSSSDSRDWGFVPEENIVGQAMLSYWPLSELGGVRNRSLDLGLLTVPLP